MTYPIGFKPRTKEQEAQMALWLRRGQQPLAPKSASLYRPQVVQETQPLYKPTPRGVTPQTPTQPIPRYDEFRKELYKQKGWVDKGDTNKMGTFATGTPFKTQEELWQATVQDSEALKTYKQLYGQGKLKQSYLSEGTQQLLPAVSKLTHPTPKQPSLSDWFWTIGNVGASLTPFGLGGQAVRAGTAAAFTGATALATKESSDNLAKNWDAMTPAQRSVGLGAVGLNAVFTYLGAKGIQMNSKQLSEYFGRTYAKSPLAEQTGAAKIGALTGRMGKETPPTKFVTGKPVTTKLYRGVSDVETVIPQRKDFGNGTYFSPQREVAESYGTVTESEVALKNPFVVKEGSPEWKQLERVVANAGKKATNSYEAAEAGKKALPAWVQKKGHDALVVERTGGDIEVILYNKVAVSEHPFTDALKMEGAEIVAKAEAVDPTNPEVVMFRKFLTDAQKAKTQPEEYAALRGMEAVEPKVRELAGVEPLGGQPPVPPQPPAPPITPPAPAPQPSGQHVGQALNKIKAMWEPKPKQPRDWHDTLLKTEEYLNDTVIGTRRLQTKVGKDIIILPGGELDFKAAVTQAPGAPYAGYANFRLRMDELNKLAPDVDPNDIFSYLYAQRGKEVLATHTTRKMAGGISSIAEYDQALLELKTSLPPDIYKQVETAATYIRDSYVLEREHMVKIGRMTKETSDLLANKYPWYSPMDYVVAEETLNLSGRSVKPYTVINTGLQKLTEKGTEKSLKNPYVIWAETLMKNEVWESKNNVAKAAIKLALSDSLPGVEKQVGTRVVAQVAGKPVFRKVGGEVPNTISFFENGKRQIYSVPPWLYRELDTLTQINSRVEVSLIGSLNGISRAAFTAYSPAFVVSNTLNDSLTAYVRQGILPWQSARQLIRSARGLSNDKIMQSFALSGGVQQRFFGESGEALLRGIKNSGGHTTTPSNFLKNVREFLPKLGEAGEQAPRRATFEKILNRTLPDWKKMTAREIAETPQARSAIQASIEATINFGRGGYLAKSANPWVIFLNANMEAMKLPFRALTESSGARWRLAGVLAGGTGIGMYNMSYPEYFDIPDYIRWGSGLIMLPSKEQDINGNAKPNYLTIIPKTREWSLFLGSMTYGLEKLYKDNPTDFGTFTKVLTPTLIPFGAEVPLPQVISEIYAQGANWDFYRSAPIVPEDLVDLPLEQQTATWVSPTIAAIANAAPPFSPDWVKSPIRLQHATSGIFGGASRAVTSVTDWVTAMIQPDQTDPKIIQLTEKYTSLTSRIKRDEFLMGLSIDEKNQIFTELRKPKKGVPILSDVIRRVYPEQSGQLYKTGQQLAEQKTGISARQTREATSQLSRVSDSLLEKQKGIDKSFTSLRISGTDWRSEHAALGQQYQGALLAIGIKFPKAAQVQQDGQKAKDYYTNIHTVASSIPDRRQRAEVLAAGWYAIDLNEPEPGTKDWDTFTTMREEYLTSLLSEDRQLLMTYLDAKRTPVEKVYARAQEILKPYWKAVDAVWQQFPPGTEDLAYQIDVYENMKSPMAKQLLIQHPEVLYARKIIAKLKKQIRAARPDIDAAIRIFY